VQHVPTGTAWWLNWTLPATGFYPQSASTIPGAWSDIAGTSYQSGGKGHIAVPAGGNQSHFRLIKRPFSKLQVILPGETAAPNTLTGKTGTPTAQTAGVPFNVTVNACDDVWNLVSSTDTINITSSDITATLPADAALVAGSGTFTVQFGMAGTFTITATNVTDNTKLPNTSSPVTVQ
jgi:hypothetical protein